jgi:hypothetical protein
MKLPKHRKWPLLVLLVASLGAGILTSAAVTNPQGFAAVFTSTSGNNGSPGHQPVGICHHTGNSQAHEWVYITPDASGVWDGHAKGGHQNFYGPEDIIPPFSFTDSAGVVHSFPGQNLGTHYDASLEPTVGGQFTGQQILNNHCAAPTVTSTTTPTTTTAPTTTTGSTTTVRTTTGSTTTGTTPSTTTVTTPGQTNTVTSTTTVTTPGQTNTVTVTTPGPTQTVTGPTQTATVTTPGPTQTVTKTVTVKTPGKTKVVVKKVVVVHVKTVKVKPKLPKHPQPTFTK